MNPCSRRSLSCKSCALNPSHGPCTLSKYLFMMLIILLHQQPASTTILSCKARCHDMSDLDCNLLTCCEQVHACRVAADFKSRIRQFGLCNNSTPNNELLCQQSTYLPISQAPLRSQVYEITSI